MTVSLRCQKLINSRGRNSDGLPCPDNPQLARLNECVDCAQAKAHALGTLSAGKRCANDVNLRGALYLAWLVHFVISKNCIYAVVFIPNSAALTPATVQATPLFGSVGKRPW